MDGWHFCLLTSTVSSQISNNLGPLTTWDGPHTKPIVTAYINGEADQHVFWAIHPWSTTQTSGPSRRPDHHDKNRRFHRERERERLTLLLHGIMEMMGFLVASSKILRFLFLEEASWSVDPLSTLYRRLPCASVTLRSPRVRTRPFDMIRSIGICALPGHGHGHGRSNVEAISQGGIKDLWLGCCVYHN